MEPGVEAACGEAERLRELRALQILDTPRERGFDRLVYIAAQVCRMPIAAVSLLDADRQWSKALIGTGFSDLPRSEAICAHALHGTAPMIVADMRADARFQGHPLVTGSPWVRFYAGVPLAAPGGALIGTLCVLDTLPRLLTEMQEWVLRMLAGEVSALMAARHPPMDGEGVVYSPWLDS